MWIIVTILAIQTTGFPVLVHCPHFFGFSISVGSGDEFPRTSTLVFTYWCCWRFRGSHGVLRWRCRRSRRRWSWGTCRQTRDNEWYIVLRVTLIFAVPDEAGNRPVVSLIRRLRRVSSNETFVVHNFAHYPRSHIVGFLKIFWRLRLDMHIVLRNLPSIRLQHGAEKHQRSSISVLVELSGTLDSRHFSAGASLLSLVLEFWCVPSAPRACDRLSAVTQCSFCESLHVQMVSRRVFFRRLLEDFGGSESWNIPPNGYEYSTLPHHCCHFLFRLLAWLFLSLLVPHSTLFAKFTARWSCAITFSVCPALRSRMFLWRTAREVLLLEPFSPIFSLSGFEEKVDILVLSLATCQLSHVPLNAATRDFWPLWFLKSTPSGRALESQSMVSLRTELKILKIKKF